MIRLIMSDMDGTLLDENGKLPAEFAEMAKALIKKGVLFVPASGRQYYTLLKQFAPYKDDFAFIGENGTFVAYKGKKLFSSTMPPQVVREMLDVAKKVSQAHVVLCGERSAYVTSDDPEFLKEAEQYYAKLQRIGDFSELDDAILKIAICDFGGAEQNSYRYFKPFYGRQYVSVSSPIWLDVMNWGVNKGNAVRCLQKYFGVEPEECMAFGDYLNDKEMLQTVFHSYAMENAHEDLRAIARFRAKSNRDQGVLHTIWETVLK